MSRIPPPHPASSRTALLRVCFARVTLGQTLQLHPGEVQISKGRRCILRQPCCCVVVLMPVLIDPFGELFLGACAVRAAQHPHVRRVCARPVLLLTLPRYCHLLKPPHPVARRVLDGTDIRECGMRDVGAKGTLARGEQLPIWGGLCEGVRESERERERERERGCRAGKRGWRAHLKLEREVRVQVGLARDGLRRGKVEHAPARVCRHTQPTRARPHERLERDAGTY